MTITDNSFSKKQLKLLVVSICFCIVWSNYEVWYRGHTADLLRCDDEETFVESLDSVMDIAEGMVIC